MNVNESEAMRRLPRTCRAADWVLWFDEVDSTNTVARRLLSEAWQPVDAAGPDVAGTATVTACHRLIPRARMLPGPRPLRRVPVLRECLATGLRTPSPSRPSL